MGAALAVVGKLAVAVGAWPKGSPERAHPQIIQLTELATGEHSA
jgi:hypothetical protein